MIKKTFSFLAFIVVIIYLMSFLPGAVKSEAKSEYVNIVSKENNINTSLFSKQTKIDYNTYMWYYVDKDRDSLYVYIHVKPFFLGGNKVIFRSSNGDKFASDFPLKN